MRKFLLAGLMIAVACSRDPQRGADTAKPAPVVKGPPAEAIAPPESIRSRPRTTDKPASPSRAQATLAPPPPSGAAASSPDTVRGIIAVVGTEHEKRVTLAPVTGGKRIEITGPLAALIGHQAATDVWVKGSRSGLTFAAAQFVVRTVDNAPAIDGRLKTEAGVLYIVTMDGARTRIVSPPPPLVGHDGDRVWITGDPSRGVQSFGFIDPPR